MKQASKPRKRKDTVINFRITAQQKQKIQEDASSLGMSVAQYLIYLSEHRDIVVLEEGKELAQAMYRMNTLLEKLEHQPFLPVREAREAMGRNIARLNRLTERG